MRECFIAAMLNPSLKSPFMQEFSRFSRIKDFAINKKTFPKIKKTLKNIFFIKIIKNVFYIYGISSLSLTYFLASNVRHSYAWLMKSHL